MQTPFIRQQKRVAILKCHDSVAVVNVVVVVVVVIVFVVVMVVVVVIVVVVASNPSYSSLSFSIS